MKYDLQLQVRGFCTLCGPREPTGLDGRELDPVID